MIKTLTIDRTIIVIGFILLFAIALRVPNDSDTWWHIRSGEQTLTHGIIYDDPFSHTYNGEKWINHSWGAQVLLSAIWQVGGNTGLALYTALLAIGGMACLYQISGGNAYLRIFTMVLGATTAAVFWSARPQMLSFFFACAILWLVYRHKRHQQDHLWLIVPLMWLWSNLHAGWSIGYLLLFAFIVGEAFNRLFNSDQHSLSWGAWRKLVQVTLLSVPLLALSPYGFDNMLVPIQTVNIAPLRTFIQEWQSPNFQQTNLLPFVAMLMLLFFALWLSRLPFDWSSFFLLIGTLLLALLYARNVALFAVVATPILTHHLDNALQVRGMILRPRRKISITLSWVNVTLIIVTLLGVILYAIGLLSPQHVEQVQAQTLPLAAVAYLNQHPAAPQVFNSYNWGGYMLFAAPQYPVFIDGRTDLYGDFVNQYAAIYSDQVASLEQTLHHYAINTVLVERVAPMNAALADLPDWQLIYEDDLSMLWRRRTNDE